MRDLIGRYLDEQGRSTTYLLAGSTLLFGVLVIAWGIYAAVRTGWFLLSATWTAWLLRTPVPIAIAVVAWVIALLWLMLMVAARDLYLQWRARRWGAERALDQIEERLFPGDSSRYLQRTRDRLALRGLESIERQLTGIPDSGKATASKDAALEERTIELGEAAAAANPPAEPT